MEDQVLFYVHPRYYFDNFQCYRVEIDGYVYRTTEHAYQSLRFRNTSPWIANVIMNAPCPHEAKRLKEKFINEIDPKYATQNPNLLTLMEKILIAKYEQHEDVRKALAKTGNRYMAEDSPTDSFWWVGPDGMGENNLGKLRMKLREKYLWLAYKPGDQE